VALDAVTGKEVWSVALGDYKTGCYSTLAPLAVRGKIIVGYSGGELGLRGSVSAFDARIGAALWSEMCLAMPGIHAMGDGYHVYVVTDASGGVSREAHDMAIRRLVAAGAQPMTWLGMAEELQRDWARRERSEEVAELVSDHAGAAGSVLAWEMQLVRVKEVKGV
jgi:nicotinamidase-related amidase